MQSFLKTGKISVDQEQSRENKPKTKGANIPWVEKYRPKNVDEVMEQTEVVSVLKECLIGADLPNLLFYGPPGTGKTTTILAIARQLFGDMYKNRILELNSSDERGIHVIREKVKNFAQMAVSSLRPDGRPCPPFKIIILDEADSMTHAAQAALRRTMERETKSTRFCLICNYVTRIIPPLTSRCTKFRFKSIKQEQIIERLKFISEKENVKFSSGSLEEIVNTSGGDLRKAITCLQSCAKLCGKNSEISVANVYDVMSFIPLDICRDFLKIIKDGAYNRLEKFIDDFEKNGYPTSNFFDEINEEIIYNEDFDEATKIKILDKLAVCSFYLQEGNSDFTVLADLGYSAISAKSSKLN